MTSGAALRWGCASFLAFLLACGGGGGSSPTPTPTPTPVPTVEVLLGGNMESDTYWNASGLLQPAPSGVTAHGGSNLAWVGGYGTPSSDVLTTEVGIPFDATSARFTFWLWVTSDEVGTTAMDTCTVKVSNSATGATLRTLATLSNLDKSPGWVQKTYDLLPYKGTVVTLEWKSVENTGAQTSFFVDDASVLIGGAANTPSVVALTATSGYAGEDLVEVLGTYTHGATAILFNGVTGTDFTRVNGGRARARVPLTATTGTVSVSTPFGTGSSSNTFTVQRRVPTITRFNPTQGPVGTKIIVEGTHLMGLTGVTLGGQAATFMVDGDDQITVTVPSGATTGALQATNGVGSALSGSPFTVSAGTITADYFIGLVHLNQASQNAAGNVPPVADRDAYLRVFVRGNQAGLPVPIVTVQLTTSGGPELLTAANTLASVPVNPSAQVWGDTLNFLLPGAKVQTGMTVQVTVNAGAVQPEVDSTNNVADWAPTVHTLSTFRTTIFPVVQGDTTGDTSAGAAGWTSVLKAVFPLSGLDAVVGSPWTYSGAALQSGGDGWSALLTALEQKRVAEASTRYYYGALNVAYSSGVAGLGYVPTAGSSNGRSAIGWDKTGFGDGGDYDDVYAHETGHNLGRSHSPCGNAASPDTSYPYAGGVIGAVGLDVSAMSLKSPSTYKDLMGYCSPNWVSDHVYKGVMAHMESTPQPAAPGYTATQPCLLVTAVQDGGGYRFEATFVLETLPTREAVDGMELEALNSGGKRLFTRRLPVSRIGCGPQEGVATIVAAIPLDGIHPSDLQTLRLVQNGIPMALLDRRASARVIARAPSARRIEGGLELNWDAGAYPSALVRDSVTGEILATLKGGTARMPLPGPYAELLLSDGLHSFRQPMPEVAN